MDQRKPTSCRGENLLPRDRQADKPAGRCPRCGGELYGRELLCRDCRRRP